jgi:hypothetical protein
MSRIMTTLAAPIAVAALSLALSGCGGSSTSSTVSSASSAASSVASSVVSSASAAASASVAAGSLASVCTQIDAVMEANPDADAAGTAQKLDDIKAKVTTPDADLIGALAAAYQAIADMPDVEAASPEGQQMASAVTDSAQAMGAACQSATTAPVPN